MPSLSHFHFLCHTNLCHAGNDTSVRLALCHRSPQVVVAPIFVLHSVMQSPFIGAASSS
jgi:hypothetical protein